jgi:hypothetical protein
MYEIAIFVKTAILELAVQVPVLPNSTQQALDRLFGLCMGLVATSNDTFV